MLVLHGSLLASMQVWLLQGLMPLCTRSRQAIMDPFQLVKEELDSVSERLRRSIFTGIPTLRSAAQYFFKARRCNPAWVPATQLSSPRWRVAAVSAHDGASACGAGGSGGQTTAANHIAADGIIIVGCGAQPALPHGG